MMSHHRHDAGFNKNNNKSDECNIHSPSHHLFRCTVTVNNYSVCITIFALILRHDHQQTLTALLGECFQATSGCEDQALLLEQRTLVILAAWLAPANGRKKAKKNASHQKSRRPVEENEREK